MKPEDVRRLLEEVAHGRTAVADAMTRLASLPYEDLGFARVDHHRALRTGFSEIVYGPGKAPHEVAAIVEAIVERGQTALVTRIEEAKAVAAVSLLAPMARAQAKVEAVPRLLLVGKENEKRGRGRLAVVSAGTADGAVAEEAARVAEILGNEVMRVRDVGVAGLHRLLPHRDALDACEVVIVVAGMEGALPSVVGGLISRPVIAVPTSVGSGASFGGLAALLGMLNSCSSQVLVVNIDNGFGAAYAASMINRVRA